MKCTIHTWYSNYYSIYYHNVYNNIIIIFLSTDVYAPLVWTIFIPLVCGLIMLCVVFLLCCVAYRLRKKKGEFSFPYTVYEETTDHSVSELHDHESENMEYATLGSMSDTREVNINYHNADTLGLQKFDTDQKPDTAIYRTVASGQDQDSLTYHTMNHTSD